jgi:hypothetical protein
MMMRRIQKNAFGRLIQSPLSDVCLRTVAGLVADAVVAADGAVAAFPETRKHDYYCHGNFADFDSDDLDLHEVSLAFEGSADDSRTVVVADVVVVADAFVHAVVCFHYYSW